MRIVRVSATDLSRFWEWYTDKSDLSMDEMLTKEEKLIESLTAPFVETRPMKLGTLIHAILEEPRKYRLTIERAGVPEVFFGDESLALLTEEDAKAMVWTDGMGIDEIPALKEYVGDEETIVLVSMRADKLDGRIGVDLKTKWSAPSRYVLDMNAERYEDSAQGLFYADAFRLEKVVYLLHYMAEEPPLMRLQHTQQVWVDTHDLEHVHQQCQRIVSTFWEWCKYHRVLVDHYTNRFLNKPETEIL